MSNNLWRNSRFTYFLASMTINNFGDWFDVFALQIIFAYEFSASPIIMGMLAFLYFIPAILLGPVAGVVADRYSKRNIMMVTDILSAVLTLGLLLSHSIGLALLLILIRSSISSLNFPTQQSYVKQIVSDEKLLEASSYTAISHQLAKIFGPVLGSVILLVAPARACLGVNAISFILSFLILLTLPADKPIPTKELQNNLKGWVSDVKSGGVFVWRHLLLRIVTALTIVWLFCNIVFLSQLTVFLKHILPGEPRVLGYVLGLEGLGAVLTGAILSRYKSISNYAYYFFAAFCLIGVGTLGIGCYQTSWLRFFLYISPFILGLGGGIGMVVQGYLIRKESPEKQLGCVFGISSATQNISLAVGTLLGGVLVMQFGTREVYIGLAVTMLLLGISAFLLLRK